MRTSSPGERLTMAGKNIRFRFAGGGRLRIRLATVGRGGDVRAASEDGGDWIVDLSLTDDLPMEIVAYVADDRSGGFVNDAYPLEVEGAAGRQSFPRPDEQLGLVVLGELYLKSNDLRLKVSNQGYTFGVEAYARARKLGDHPFPGRGSSRRARDLEADRADALISSGSGVVIGDGLLLTNAHVVEGGLRILDAAGRALQVVAVDRFHDVALLRGSTPGRPLPLRDDPVWLGEPMMAAGFPLMEILGADLKVSTGNVSGLVGAAGDVTRFQFTAPIGSGSSGGAVLDDDGQLVGMTCASLAHDEMRHRGSMSENVNFAVKASILREMVASVGEALPPASALQATSRREVVQRARSGVVSLTVEGR